MTQNTQGDIAEALKAIDAGTALTEAEHKAGLAALPHVRTSRDVPAAQTAPATVGSPHADEEANNAAGSHGDEAVGNGSVDPLGKASLDARTVASVATSLQVRCSFVCARCRHRWRLWSMQCTLCGTVLLC